MKHIIIFAILLFAMPQVFAQANTSPGITTDAMPIQAITTQDTNASNTSSATGKDAKQSDTQDASVTLTQQRYDEIKNETKWWQDLRFLVFILAIVVIIAEVYLIKVIKFNWSPYSVIRLLGLTLIIFATLILSVDPTIQEKTLTHVIGLLGAVAGYLLGKDSKEVDFPTAPEAPAQPGSKPDKQEE